MLYEIFVKATSLPSEKRKTYLDEVKHSHPDLFEELLEMLKDDEASIEMDTQYWSSLMANESAGIVNSFQDLTGSIISSFQLIELIDKGGMGSVYKAQRCDDQFEQTVAIKIIHSELEKIIGEHALIREAGFMAKLTHPNIGKVFDAGVSSDGHHFIVMEYIDGCTITEKFKETTLTLNEKLNIFCDLCDAVNHAHQMQVIHADLKPANILISQDNQVKILDFGISRMFNSRSNDSSVAYTSYLNAMTASYASPELLAGESPNLYSDIYALGKIFSVLFIQQKTNEKDYFGELEAIAKEATAEIPTERYASVLELKNDITLYINKQVVKAFPASNLYRAKKFVFKRHPITTFLIATLLISITTLTTNLFIQQQDLKQAKEQSDLLVDKFIDSLVFADKRENNGKEFSAKDLLDNINATLSSNSLNSDPLARIKLALAKSYISIGNMEVGSNLRREVINDIDHLTNKDLAFKAGQQHVFWLARTNQFELVEPDLAALVNKITYDESQVLPTSITQAMFYQKYLDVLKYHKFNSKPSHLGEKHIQLLYAIKNHYWPELTPQNRAAVLSNLSGAKYLQIPSHSMFTFEYADNDVYSKVYKPSIEESVKLINQAISIYADLGFKNGVAVVKLVTTRMLIEVGKYDEAKQNVAEAIKTQEKLYGKNNSMLIQQYENAAAYLGYIFPELSLNYAFKGYSLALEKPELQFIQQAIATVAYLDTLYSAGKFKEYRNVSDSFFDASLSLPNAQYSKRTLQLTTKILSNYYELFGVLPKNHNALLDNMKRAYLNNIEKFSSDSIAENWNINLPFYEKMELIADGITPKELIAKDDKMASQISSDITPFEAFLKKQKMINSALNTALYKDPNEAIDKLNMIPEFVWNDIEDAYSINKLDVLFKQAFIYLLAQDDKKANSSIIIARRLLDNLKLEKDNAWDIRLKFIEAKLSVAKGRVSQGNAILHDITPLMVLQFTENSWIYEQIRKI